MIVLLGAAGAFACSESASPTGSGEATADVSASPLATPSAVGSGTFCTVDLPEDWRSLLAQGRIGLPDDDRFGAFAAAADGSHAYGGISSQDWSGVAAVSRDGSITRIRPFDDPATDGIVGGSFDGRWLVWSEDHSSTDWNDWDIRAWDASSGEVVDIATAPRVGAATVQGPFVMPVVSGGKAAWVQANQSGQGEVHLYSLAERRDVVLWTGQAAKTVVFWGSMLLWGEVDAPGVGHLAAGDATTGEQLTLPEPLASLRHFGSIAASDDLLAWTSDFHSVSTWRVGDAEASQIFTAEPGDGVDWIAIAGDLVTWGGVKTQWAADLRSHSVTRITQQYGWRYTSGNALLVTQPIGPLKKEEGRPPLSKVDLVDATRLPPLPGCGP